MYDFWYNVIKVEYGEKPQLLFTDTDSLMIEMHDAHADMWANKHPYDFSDCPKDSQYHDDSNKKVIGKFKDELLYSNCGVHKSEAKNVFDREI